MALLELKGFGVERGAARVAGIDLVIEPATMLAVVGRGDGTVSLLALAIAGLLPKGAAITGTMTFAGKRVLYLDREADASALTGEAELIVADEPGRGRDPATQLALLEALQQASRTAAVVIFTADFRLALSMGLEVAVIAGGKLLLKAPASQIFELPQYDTVRHLVGGERVRTRTLMRPPIGEPVLELDGVEKSYRRGLPRLGPPPVAALKGIGFAVRQGEVVGVLGPAGAGKSTLLRLIAGLETHSGGHIGRREGLVGYVFSDPRRAFNPTLPVGVSLTEPLRVEQTLLVEEQADRLVEVVRAVGLQPELLTRLPGEFGVADLQRLALARALAGRPNLLLLDDPTACLDPPEVREFLVLFARVRADFGLTAIVTSREFEVLRSVADRLLVLEAGQIVEGGKPSELSEAPKQEITRRLVSGRYPPPVRPVDERVLNADEQAAASAPVDVAASGEASLPDANKPIPNASGGDQSPAPLIVSAVEAVLGDAPSIALSGGPFEHSSQGVLASNGSTGAIRPAGQLEDLPPLGGSGSLSPSADESPADESIGVPAPEPEPVHSLSAKIVIAPVVLSEPVMAAGLAAEVAETPVAMPSEAATDPAPNSAPDPVVVEAESTNAAVEAAPTPVEPAAEPEPIVVETAQPKPPASEPAPAPEAAPPSDDGGDETAEGGEGQVAVDGVVDAAGRVEATEGEVGR